MGNYGEFSHEFLSNFWIDRRLVVNVVSKTVVCTQFDFLTAKISLSLLQGLKAF